MNKLITIAISLLIAFPILAQNKGNERERRRDQIESAKIAFYTTEIGITPEEATSFWPIYNQYWKDMYEASRNTHKALMALRKMDEKGNFSEIDFKKAIQLYVSSFKKENEINEMYYFEFLKVLSAEKVAKFYIAEDDFRIKMINMWKDPGKPQQDVKDGSKPHPPMPDCPDCTL